jgi:cytochrome c556
MILLGQLIVATLFAGCAQPGAEGRPTDQPVVSSTSDSAAMDDRTPIRVDAAARWAVLTEMRMMLNAVQGIVGGAANGDTAAMRAAAKSVGVAAAAEGKGNVAAVLGPDFMLLGMRTHASFDSLAADITQGKNGAVVLRRLATVMGNCVGCHNQFRLVVEP